MDNAKVVSVLTILKKYESQWEGLSHIWRLSENSVPLNPMVLLIIIPIKWL